MIDAHVSHALPKLTVAQMFADATPVVKIVLTGMLLTGLVAFVILLIGLVVGKGGRMASAARFLEAAMIATPIAALLGATVVGQFGGPILIGWLNDHMHAQFGDEAIRYSMLVVMACAFLAGLCYLVASRYVVADTKRAAEA